jgi:hypothetical protein
MRQEVIAGKVVPKHQLPNVPAARNSFLFSAPLPVHLDHRLSQQAPRQPQSLLALRTIARPRRSFYESQLVAVAVNCLLRLRVRLG